MAILTFFFFFLFRSWKNRFTKKEKMRLGVGNQRGKHFPNTIQKMRCVVNIQTFFLKTFYWIVYLEIKVIFSYFCSQYMPFLRNSIKNDIENYLENPAANIGMPWNYTKDQRVTLCRQAENMNLVYEEFRSHPANLLISIHKRGSAVLLTERDEILHRPEELVASDEEDCEEDGFTGWDLVELNEQSKEEVVDLDAYEEEEEEDDVVVLVSEEEEPSAAPSALRKANEEVIRLPSDRLITSHDVIMTEPMDEDEVFVISDSDDELEVAKQRDNELLSIINSCQDALRW